MSLSRWPGAESAQVAHRAASCWSPHRVVCASPAVVLASQGLLGKGEATSYPAPQFKELVGSQWTDAKAVIELTCSGGDSAMGSVATLTPVAAIRDH
eukprot:5963730-Amphidinium_carterae.2